MSTSYVLLTGNLSNDQSPDEVWPRVAQVFNLSLEDFRERALRRAPCIIKQGLSEAAAKAFACRLTELGAKVVVLMEESQLLEINRAGAVLGPVPAESGKQFLCAGDHCRIRGTQTWTPWSKSGSFSILPPGAELTLDSFDDELSSLRVRSPRVVLPHGQAAPPSLISNTAPPATVLSVPLPPWLDTAQVTLDLPHSQI